MCGASLTLVTNIADLCRYTPTRRDVRIGLFASSVLAVAYRPSSAGSGRGHRRAQPVHRGRRAHGRRACARADARRDRRPGHRRQHHERLHGRHVARKRGSRVGRLVATIVAAAAAVALSAFPDVIEEAERWVGYLGNVAAPLTGVVLADYLVTQRSGSTSRRCSTPGRYHYVRGVNAAALVAVAAGVIAYSLVPDAWVKVVWGLAAGPLSTWRSSRCSRRCSRARDAHRRPRRRRDGRVPPRHAVRARLRRARPAEIASSGSPVEACDRIRPRFAELLADPDWLPTRTRARPGERHGRRHRPVAARPRDDGSLTLFSLVVPSGSATLHDHLAWGLVGLYRGEQDEEIFAHDGGELRLASGARSARGLLRAAAAAGRHPPRTDDLGRARSRSTCSRTTRAASGGTPTTPNRARSTLSAPATPTRPARPTANDAV